MDRFLLLSESLDTGRLLGALAESRCFARSWTLSLSMFVYSSESTVRARVNMEGVVSAFVRFDGSCSVGLTGGSLTPKSGISAGHLQTVYIMWVTDPHFSCV